MLPPLHSKGPCTLYIPRVHAASAVHAPTSFQVSMHPLHSKDPRTHFIPEIHALTSFQESMHLLHSKGPHTSALLVSMYLPDLMIIKTLRSWCKVPLSNIHNLHKHFCQELTHRNFYFLFYFILFSYHRKN